MISSKWMPNLKSLMAVFACIAVIGYSLYTRPFRSSISWDVFGYYLYLPAIFYHNDLEISDVEWADAARTKYDLSGTLYQLHDAGNGNRVIQYSCGMAVMMTPAFFAGHLLAQCYDEPADGFSWPYQLCVNWWSFLVLCAGLVLVRKILLQYFRDPYVALLLVLLVAGTNFFIQVCGNVSTSHTYLFTLYALFLWNVLKWHQHYRWAHLCGMAITLGLACLARPTEMVMLILPVFWNCESLSAVSAKWKLLFRNKRQQLIAFALILLLMALPQLLYWKYVTGHFLFMSYRNPGEGFDFLSPHTINFLFSFRKGWFIYTPLIMLSLAGFIYLYRSRHKLFPALLCFFLVNLFIVSSWTCWWYAASYSQRSMVQSYPVMVLLGGFALLLPRSVISRIMTACMVGALLALNIFQSWQYDHAVLDKSRMTRSAYLAIFGQTNAPAGMDSLLRVEYATSNEESTVIKYPGKYESKHLQLIDFTGADPQKFMLTADSTSNMIARMDSTREFLNGLEMRFSEITSNDYCYVRPEVMIYSDDTLTDELLLVCAINHDGRDYGYTTHGFARGIFQPGQWNKLSFLYLTPPVRSGKDKLYVYLWYRGKKPVFADNFRIDADVLKPGYE